MARRRVSQRARLALVLALSLGTASTLMLGLPLLYLTLPNPSVERLAAVEGSGRGMYLQADGQSYRLFPRSQPLRRAASDVPVVHEIDRVLVLVRQPGRPSEYRMRVLGGAAVPADVETAADGDLTAVAVKPARRNLAAGTYEVTVPRESMFGGEDYVYFTISR